jgi:hypothetical protein
LFLNTKDLVIIKDDFSVEKNINKNPPNLSIQEGKH